MSDRPLVTVIVLGYNQEKFIRQAVQSALVQTYANLEIVFCDDASSDRTFEIMTEEANRYKGSHRLVLHRNSKNLGLTGNLNNALQLASGDLLIEQDGDDISFPTRVSKLVERWVSEQPRRDLIFSDVVRIAADGSVLPQQVPPLPVATLEDLVRGKFFIAGGCAVAYSRSLVERFGPVDPAVKYVDYVWTFRALLGSGCAFVNEPLLCYRVHGNSIDQTVVNPEKTRRAGAQWAAHAVPEAQELLRTMDFSGKKCFLLRRKLARNLAYERLNSSSSRGSRLTALGCSICAIGTGRPKAAWTFFRRDVLNLELQ
jgi:glycosyltransferase involved in cell wall biosynthesis